MKKRVKRVLSLAMVGAMLASLLCITSFAAEEASVSIEAHKLTAEELDTYQITDPDVYGLFFTGEPGIGDDGEARKMIMMSTVVSYDNTVIFPYNVIYDEPLASIDELGDAFTGVYDVRGSRYSATAIAVAENGTVTTFEFGVLASDPDRVTETGPQMMYVMMFKILDNDESNLKKGSFLLTSDPDALDSVQASDTVTVNTADSALNYKYQYTAGKSGNTLAAPSLVYPNSTVAQIGSLELTANANQITADGKEDVKVTLTVTAKDVDGDAYPTDGVQFSFNDGGTGATRDGTVITVPGMAKAGTITVSASLADMTSNEVTINVVREASVPAQVEISGGAEKITVPALGEENATTTFTAAVTDQFGGKLDQQVVWSVEPVISGVYIDENGVLTVKALEITGDTDVTVYATAGNAQDKCLVYLLLDQTVTGVKLTEGAADADNSYTLVIPAEGETELTLTAQGMNKYGQGSTNDYTVSWSGDLPDQLYKVSSTGGKTDNQVLITIPAGTQPGNYTLTADINGKTAEVKFQILDKIPTNVEMGGITLSDKTYDGQAITYTGEAEAAVQVDKIVYTWESQDGQALSAAPVDAGTYYLVATVEDDLYAGSAKLKVSVTPKPVTVTGLTGVEKEYDGTTEVQIAAGAAQIAGLVGQDDVGVLSAAGVYADANAGQDKAITITNVVLKGSDKGNYKVSTMPTDVAGTIAPRPVELTWDYAEPFEFDNTRKTVTAEVSNLVAGDVVNLTYEGNSATNKGTYSAKVTELDNANYTLSGGSGLTLSWEIAGVSIANAVVTLDKTSYVFDNQEHKPAVTSVMLGEIPLAEDVDYTVSYQGDLVNAGSVTVTVTGTGNYSGKAAASYVIEAATLTITGAAVEDKTYDGTVDAKVTGVSFQGVAADDSLEAGAGYTASAVFDGANAGTDKEVIVTVTLNNGNYTFDEGKTADYVLAGQTIRKAEASEAMTTASGYLYLNADGTVELPALPEGAEYGIYSIDSDVVVYGDISNGQFHYTGGSNVETGEEYEVTVPVTGAVNYYDYDIIITLVGTDKKPVTITGVQAAEGLIYNGKAQQGYTGTPAAQDYDGDFIVTYVPGGDQAPVKPGEYQVIFTIPDSAQVVGSLTLNFTIGKAPVTVTAPSMSVYVGGEIPELSGLDCEIEGLAGNDTLTDVALAYAVTPSTAAPGTFEIIPSGGVLTNADCYQVTYKNGTLTVSEKITPELTLTADPESMRGSGTVTLTISGLPAGGTAVVTCDDETVTVTESGDGWTVDLPNETKTYTFTAVYDGDAAHNGAVTQCTVEVTRRSSSGGGSSGGQSETVTNPDGSTTTIKTDSNGNVTETTKNPDGSQTVVETNTNGTVTTTNTDASGNETQVVEKADGSVETTVDNRDGSSSTTTVAEDGSTEAQVSLSSQAVSEAGDKGEAVKLPMPQVSASDDSEKAPAVTVELPDSSTPVKVEIPVENVTSGTVAVIVKADGTEAVVKSSVATDTGVVVTLTDGDTVKIVDLSKSFVDVPDNFWGKTYIDFVVSHGLFSGTSETTFSPNAPMTRGMIVTVLAAYHGENTVAAPGQAWYEAGRQWAMSYGVSDGTNMDGNLQREQLAVMLWSYAGRPAASGSLSSYPDAAAVSDWAVEAMSWAVDNGMISGENGMLNPQGNATRAQVATILMRFVEKFGA